MDDYYGIGPNYYDVSSRVTLRPIVQQTKQTPNNMICTISILTLLPTIVALVVFARSHRSTCDHASLIYPLVSLGKQRLAYMAFFGHLDWLGAGTVV